MLQVCKCSGSGAFVHINCLKHWINTRKHYCESLTFRCFYWRNFGCEICKTMYPYTFKAHGRKYSLFDIPKPTHDYSMLEGLSLNKSMSRMV